MTSCPCLDTGLTSLTLCPCLDTGLTRSDCIFPSRTRHALLHGHYLDLSNLLSENVEKSLVCFVIETVYLSVSLKGEGEFVIYKQTKFGGITEGGKKGTIVLRDLSTKESTKRCPRDNKPR